MTQEGKDMLVGHEGGYCLAPYLDTEGWLTIGIGHNLQVLLSPGTLLPNVESITSEVAALMFSTDLDRATDDAKVVCGHFNSLTPARQDVLVNMSFNLGRSRLSTFRKMLMALEVDNYELASSEMLDSRWAAQVGGRATTLAEIMKRGKYEPTKAED